MPRRPPPPPAAGPVSGLDVITAALPYAACPCVNARALAERSDASPCHPADPDAVTGTAVPGQRAAPAARALPRLASIAAC